MTEEKQEFRQFFTQVKTKPKFWDDDRHMQRIIHRLPNSFQALIL